LTVDPAAALAELRHRRDQIATEHARPQARWRLALSMALAFGHHAMRELDGRPIKRPLSIALGAVDLAMAFAAAGEPRVETRFGWLKQTVPDGADPPPPELLTPDRTGPRGPGVLLVGVLLTAGLLPRWLVPRLERRGVRHPHLLTGVVAAGVVPFGELSQRLFRRGFDIARLLPDVSSAASFPTGFAPRPVEAPLLADPALLSLAGLLAPADGVSRSLLRELLGLDDAALGERLRALTAVGWIEPSGRTRRDPKVCLTPAGRSAVAAHAAWLRDQAAA
jgi:hypothetical protein